MGYVGNNGTTNVDYATSIEQRIEAPPPPPPANVPYGAFKNGKTTGVSYADFDQSYTAINSYEQGSGAGTYTVRRGDTLQGLAAGLYGDSSLWYKIAEINGLSANAALIEGQSLTLPAGVVRNTNNAATFQPYDPASTIGDTSPTAAAAPPKQKKGCGGIGAILMAVVAFAVAAVVAPWALGTAATTAGVGGATVTASATGLTAFFGGAAATSAGVAATVTAGAIAGAAGSIVSQAVGVATGIQEKFSWKAVALAAIGGGVGAGMAGKFGSTVLGKMAEGAASSAITQGIGVVTGLQDKFSWAAVAAAGVGAGVAAKVGASKFVQKMGADTLAADIVINGASAIANAATRTLIDGSDFGDNIIAALPDVLGGAIGRKIGGGVLAGMNSIKSSGAPLGIRNFTDSDPDSSYGSMTEPVATVAQEVARTAEIVVVTAQAKAKSLWGKVRDGALFGAGVGWGALRDLWQAGATAIDFVVRDLGGSALYGVTGDARFKQSWVDVQDAGRRVTNLARQAITDPRGLVDNVVANHRRERAASNALTSPFARGASNPDWQLGVNVVTTLAGGAGAVKAMASGPKVAINLERAAEAADAIVVNQSAFVNGATGTLPRFGPSPYLTDGDLLQSIATRADNWGARGMIGNGPIVGTYKHEYAKEMLIRYQRVFGNRGLSAEQRYVNGNEWQVGDPLAGSIRLDVVKGPLAQPSIIWDYKFGAAILSQSRINQIQSGIPGGVNVPVLEVKP